MERIFNKHKAAVCRPHFAYTEKCYITGNSTRVIGIKKEYSNENSKTYNEIVN